MKRSASYCDWCDRSGHTQDECRNFRAYSRRIEEACRPRLRNNLNQSEKGPRNKKACRTHRERRNKYKNEHKSTDPASAGSCKTEDIYKIEDTVGAASVNDRQSPTLPPVIVTAHSPANETAGWASLISRFGDLTAEEQTLLEFTLKNWRTGESLESRFQIEDD